ncbi:hypothetical protein NONI108955_44610 [Nocardia ninae]
MRIELPGQLATDLLQMIEHPLQFGVGLRRVTPIRLVEGGYLTR